MTTGRAYYRGRPHDGQIQLAVPDRDKIMLFPDGSKYRLTDEKVRKGVYEYPVMQFIEQAQN